MDLQTFFAENNKVALAFSGGVDSSFLLWAALHYGATVRAYYLQSAFQPQFEREDACRLAEQLHANLKILPVDVLACPEVVSNPANRCYHCKRQLFGLIQAQARADGFTTLLDGTNASDDVADRPGMRALQELSVRSPLRECGLTKPEIRRLSRQAGLFTWDKPAYACLATRIPTGDVITPEKLEKTERAEAYLFGLGFTDFRVRLRDGAARLELPAAQLPLVLEHRKEIVDTLKKDYTAVLLNLEARDE